MEHLTKNTPLTFESLMASIHENDRILSERFAETDRVLSEKFAETDRMQKETDRMQKENAKQQKENERNSKKVFAEMRRQFNETNAKRDREWDKYERRMKNMEERLGSWSKSSGSFAEEYFINSFEDRHHNFFGEQFDDMEYCLKPKSVKVNDVKLQDEYDIVLYNHSSVAIIEVKFKAHENDVPKTLKKAETFRILCPDYKDFKIYLGLASMSFYPELEQMCTDQGIAIIKQVGDSVVINDAHLKVF